MKIKLTEREKAYTWRQWLQVLWLAIRHPVHFSRYLKERKKGITAQERRAKQMTDLQKQYIEPLGQVVAKENGEEIKRNWR